MRKQSAWDSPLKKTLTNNEILSQALLFLAAGFETTATSLEFIAYNLAMHPSVQEKLIDEVDQVLENNVKKNSTFSASKSWIIIKMRVSLN